MVVNKGDDCVIGLVFQKGITSDNCAISTDGFRWIGIGNGTFTSADAGDLTLVDGNSYEIANSTNDGIMAVKVDTDTVGVASSDGGTVAIQTETAFTFNSGNATVIKAAGLFDANCPTVSSTTGSCLTNYANAMNMFSAQILNITVAAGDSLTVTWTITVGSNA
jgi:hypothetical protein